MRVFYRNKVDLKSTQGVLIDAHSLWERKGQLMILVDDDQYITHPYDINLFLMDKKI